jgi:hypothetical protein
VIDSGEAADSSDSSQEDTLAHPATPSRETV